MCVFYEQYASPVWQTKLKSNVLILAPGAFLCSTGLVFGHEELDGEVVHEADVPATEKSGNAFRVGIFLDFVRLATRMPRGAYVRRRAGGQTKSN